MHDWNFWIAMASLVLSVVMAIGGFIMSLISGLLWWGIKRLISAVDRLSKDIEDLRLTMKDKPDWSLVDSKIADAIKHHQDAEHRNRRAA